MNGHNNDADDFSSDGEDTQQVLIKSKPKSAALPLIDKDREDDIVTQEADNDAAVTGVSVEKDTRTKIDRLAKLKQTKKQKHKTGVVYLSSLPPYMKPAKVRQILSKFGELDRLFLKREDEQAHKQRVKSGGNKKVRYEEGWAEFIRKRDAKLCAETLNGNIVGGKKGAFYHDDILNIKYLPGFKWADLTEQIARENDIRQSKLNLEISQANKLNADYIRNVEKSKMIANIKSARERKQPVENASDNAQNPQRHYNQHKVASSRADAPADHKTAGQGASTALNNVLNTLL